jgi:hypothetical protein
MTYSLRNIRSGKFLTRTGEWAVDVAAALCFNTAAEADHYRLDCGIEGSAVFPPPDVPKPRRPKPRW